MYRSSRTRRSCSWGFFPSVFQTLPRIASSSRGSRGTKWTRWLPKPGTTSWSIRRTSASTVARPSLPLSSVRMTIERTALSAVTRVLVTGGLKIARRELLSSLADRVLELPAAPSVACDAPKFERADLGDVGLEAHRDELAGRALPVGLDQLLDRIELDQAVAVGVE